MCINTYVCARGRSEDRVRKEDSRQILSSRRTSPLARPPPILLCNARTDVALIIESALGVDMRLVVAIGWIMIFQTFSTQSEQQPPGGVIAGIVVRAGTGEPIAGARVLAQPTTPPRPTPGGAAPEAPSMPPAVTTDGQGRFAFKDLHAGPYRLFIFADGYVRHEYVPADQTLQNVRVLLTPAGNVSGNIRDLDGKPLAGVPVQILKPVYNFLGDQTLQSAGAAVTDDRGEYRVYWVTPGRYYVLAGSAISARRAAMPGIASPNEVPGHSVLPTYYPNATDLSGATPIAIQTGTDLNNIDFVLERQQARRIRGRVVDAATGKWPPVATVRLVTRSAIGGTSARESLQSYNPADGTFDVRDVPPGPHQIVVEVRSPGAPGPPVTPPIVPAGAGQAGSITFGGSRALVTAAAQIEVQVGNEDVDNLVVTIGAAGSLPGRLIIEGASTVSGADRLRVQLTPLLAGAMQGPVPVPANPGGTFTIDNVLPGDYRVQVAGLQADFYLKEARFGSQDVLNKPLNFSQSGPASLDVIIGTGVSRIEGTVIDERSQPVRSVAAILVPDQLRGRPDLFRNVTTDQSGRFRMEGIAPGDYKAFAWETLEPFSYYDPDFVRRYEQHGHPVKVSESSNQTIQVQLIRSGQ